MTAAIDVHDHLFATRLVAPLTQAGLDRIGG